MKLVMPERLPDDGPINVSRVDEDHLRIRIEADDGTSSSIKVSEHNAWRIFGMLSIMLEIPLPAATGKAIKF